MNRTTSPLISRLSMVMREHELTYDEELERSKGEATVHLAES
jgi:hypothetical protein